MITQRLIPCLLIDNNKLVKTINFKNPKYVGDPINVLKIFNEKEVDEILVIDISITKNKILPNYKLINQIASECFMPLTYGGGINSLDIAKKIFDQGVEKICLNNILFVENTLLSSLINIYGSASIIASIDLKKDLFGNLRIFSYKTNKFIKVSLSDFINNLIKIGIGEILFNFIDNDGKMLGPDFTFITEFVNKLPIPFIILGGISSINDINTLFHMGVNGVAAGSFFIFHGPHKAVLITYPSQNEITK